MKTNQSILFPTDLSVDSLNALDYAVDYAKKSGASLTLVNVIEYPWRIVDSVVSMIKPDVFDKSEVVSASKYVLKKLTAKIKKDHSINVNYKLLYGNLIKSVVEYIKDMNPKLMILTASGSGSKTGYRLADYAPISVVTVNKATTFHPVKRILFPINDKLITTKKLKELVRISKIYKAEIVLLGIAKNANESLEEMSIYMESILKKLQTNKIPTKLSMVVDNDYGEAIKKYSSENDIDLISVVSNNDHGLLNLFKTTTDEKLVKEASIPVLNIPVDPENPPTSYRETEYISPWSMRYDESKIIIPLKKH